MPKKPDEHTPHPLDIALGSRVRLRRKELKISQSTLAQATGITFQQIQKYEHGTNRISFSRLVEIAGGLKCSAMDFIGDLDKSVNSAAFSRHVAFLNEPGANDLLAAYASIKSRKRRLAIVSLARQLSSDPVGNTHTEPPRRGRARAASAKRDR